MDSQVYAIPAPSFASVLPVLLVPLVVSIAISLALVGPGLRLSCALERTGLRLRGAGYGRLVPWASIEPAGAEVIDLRQRRDYLPRVRTNGIGLPGYRVGWFGLANGKRALLFVTDSKVVVRVPTRDGFDLLIGAANPHALQRAIAAHTDP
jgi:hypothetical protein